MHLKWGSNGEMKQLSDTQCLPAPATQAGLIYYQKSGYREFIPSRQTDRRDNKWAKDETTASQKVEDSTETCQLCMTSSVVATSAARWMMSLLDISMCWVSNGHDATSGCTIAKSGL